MLDCAWTVFLLLICGMWWYKCYIHRITYRQTKISLHTKENQEEPRETACGTMSITSGWRKKVTESLISCQIWIVWPQTRIILRAKPSCTFLKTTELWSRWSSMDEVRWWDTCPETTESRWNGCLTVSTWTEDPYQICWHQKPTRWLVDWRQFHAWWLV